MRRSTWIAVITTVAVLAAVIALAVGAAHRDRAALVKEFGGEHLARLRIAIREIESELADVRLHLAFAAKLVDAADTGKDQRRELEALLTVVRAYRTIVVYGVDGKERVVAVDPAVAGTWSRRPFAEAVRETALDAMRRQAMAISAPLGDQAMPWHRAFAAPLLRDGAVRGAVVILVDQQATFDRLRLAALEPHAKLLLVGPHGSAAPLTDPAVTAALGERDGPRALFRELREAMGAGHTGVQVLSAVQARALGFHGPDAVAVFAPIRTEDAGHWSVAVIDSTAALEAQEDAIILRMILLAAAFVLALGALSVYLVVSARRAFAVQERLRGAEEMARVRERAERILENVPVAVVALDGSGRISGLNLAFRERAPHAAAGAALDEVFPAAAPGAVEGLRSVIGRARSTGVVQAAVAQPLALVPGRHHAVHAVPLPAPLPDMAMLVVLDDVTEMRALSSQLLRAEKLATLGVLASGIAHEVGTPLGVVRGRTEMLASKLGPGHAEARTTRVILEEIDRISRTIHQLLDFTRVSQADASPVPLAAAAANVQELLAFEARKRKVSLEVDVAAGLAPLAANADQLKQVLVNLVLNGLDACGPGGRVAVRGRPGPRAGYASVEVVDDGGGIAETLRHRVFDPFFTTKKRGKGTGLGLTVAAQIVRNHGGDIDLESEPGRGTRVLMSWPLAAQVEERDGDARRRADSGR